MWGGGKPRGARSAVCVTTNTVSRAGALPATAAPLGQQRRGLCGAELGALPARRAGSRSPGVQQASREHVQREGVAGADPIAGEFAVREYAAHVLTRRPRKRAWAQCHPEIVASLLHQHAVNLRNARTSTLVGLRAKRCRTRCSDTSVCVLDVATGVELAAVRAALGATTPALPKQTHAGSADPSMRCMPPVAWRCGFPPPSATSGLDRRRHPMPHPPGPRARGPAWAGSGGRRDCRSHSLALLVPSRPARRNNRHRCSISGQPFSAFWLRSSVVTVLNDMKVIPR